MALKGRSAGARSSGRPGRILGNSSWGFMVWRSGLLEELMPRILNL